MEALPQNRAGNLAVGTLEMPLPIKTSNCCLPTSRTEWNSFRAPMVNPTSGMLTGRALSATSPMAWRRFINTSRRFRSRPTQARSLAGRVACRDSTSLGFSHAVLKNPLTQWGGYCVGKDAEVINWIGPDGSSSLPSAMRWSANGNWPVSAAFPRLRQECQGRRNRDPVGMCFQDAGWTNGPWGCRTPSINRTWSEYFEQVADKPKTDWRFSQENIRVSLVWGSQALQGIAQNVRRAENKIVATEKIAAMAAVDFSAKWPEDDFREAWRTLMLSQHHDCWIVPLNTHPAGTWARQVTTDWIPNTQERCDGILARALQDLAAGGGEGRRTICSRGQSGQR